MDLVSIGMVILYCVIAFVVAAVVFGIVCF